MILGVEGGAGCIFRMDGCYFRCVRVYILVGTQKCTSTQSAQRKHVRTNIFGNLSTFSSILFTSSILSNQKLCYPSSPIMVLVPPDFGSPLLRFFHSIRDGRGEREEEVVGGGFLPY